MELVTRTSLICISCTSVLVVLVHYHNIMPTVALMIANVGRVREAVMVTLMPVKDLWFAAAINAFEVEEAVAVVDSQRSS